MRFPTFIRRAIFMYSGMLVVVAAAVIASQVFASTPKIVDEFGQPLKGSIASLEQVELNGTKQWITIRGKDMGKPILLYLGIGGPGAGGFPATSTSLKPLEDNFIVVNWDQPGTGKSYGAMPIANLTPQRIVDDGITLTEMLIKRFRKDKIYVLGQSWGTIVGIIMIAQSPDLFHAYIGTGQMVNIVENDRYGYNLALKLAQDQGKYKLYDELNNSGPPPYGGVDMAWKYILYNNVLFDHMDSPNIWTIITVIPQLAREYGLWDKINFGRGLLESFQVLYPQLTDLDFATQVPKVNVPVYFLVGRKDVNAVARIVEEYFAMLEAPHKELIWLQSGHGATAKEIKDAMLNQVLKTSRY